MYVQYIYTYEGLTNRGANWIDYRDAFVLKLQAIESARGFPLSYFIDDTPRQIRHANAAHIEVDVLDLSNEETFITTAVHFGNAFKTDNKKLWAILEAKLVNSDPYNHIAEFSIRKDGRAAWIALKSHFEGEDYVQKIRSNAFNKLKTTVYRGETKTFKFEDYMNVHIKVHKQLLDIKYNRGLGLDDATKIVHFKAGIQPAADLETAITLARPYETKPFREYTPFLGTEVDSKNQRKLQTAQNDRCVSNVQKDKKKFKGKQNLGPALYETVDGKRLESKNYPQAEFAALNKKQRTAVIRLNRERKRRATQGTDDKKTATSHNISELKKEITEDIASVGEFIIFALDKTGSDANDDMTAITVETGKRTKATAGSIGDFIVDARKRRKGKNK